MATVWEQMVLYVKDTLYSYRELKVSFYLQTKFQKTCSGTQQSVRFLGVNWLELFFIWARFPRFTKSKILQGCMEMWQWHLLSSWANSFVRKMLLLEDISRMDVVPVGDCLPFINCLLSAVRHSLWITSRKEVTSQEVKIENIVQAMREDWGSTCEAMKYSYVKVNFQNE